MTATTQTLVDTLRQRDAFTHEHLAQAFASVPRHAFLPASDLNQVYSDVTIPVRFDTQGNVICSATMPSMVAFLLDQAQVRPGQNILQIGSGTGYVSALLKYLVGDKGRVTALELDRAISQITSENLQTAGYGDVVVVNVDGTQGYAPRAAYDHIVSTVGVWDIPDAWMRQLKPGGRIVMPVMIDGLQVTGTFTPQPDATISCGQVRPSAFDFIRGSAATPNYKVRLGAMDLIADDVDTLDTAALHLLLSADHELAVLSTALDSSAYWYGFLPYLILHKHKDQVFALFHIADGQQAYGIEREGFALFTPASACFVPYLANGMSHCFAGADAFLELETLVNQWKGAGEPDISKMRLRFVPKNTQILHKGKTYSRRNHDLQVWLEDA